MALPRFSSTLIGAPTSTSFFRSVHPILHPSLPHLPNRVLAASLAVHNSSLPITTEAPKTTRWKPLCLYHTHGKCTQVDDPLHLEKFNHNYQIDLQVNAAELDNLRPQNFDYFLVLDLEGKVEILEFPVVMINAKNMEFIDLFHRFVRPVGMSEKRISEYIEGKYGKLGLERVWHDTATPFKDVLQEFQIWMEKHFILEKESGGPLHGAAFVTCGNWDLKTKIPEQLKVSKIKPPAYFMEWINLKDIYLNFYNRRATGMMTMMRELNIPLLGSHHLGIDDTKNIARVLQHMLADGAVLQVTAKRSSSVTGDVKFFFKNRIR
ncbi:3'-5' exoribonuclease 1 protein [Dioscorea alata]|uniref:3'-5' exoribonuclease 1 protein n=2 Tax=Dioscorea alata TaxID=55571 RepID=A0ACB7W4A4_DIOAL|nr:3'-5' exoribonuclease 1 protein [Dioscorea alata]